jgi:hypothetical protein
VKYLITMRVRRRGATGIFYDMDFELNAPVNATNDQIVYAWVSAFGDNWEPSTLTFKVKATEE